MSLLTDTLRPEEGATRPLGTVVHIGAGSGLVLADYMSLRPQALVLVEGDADNAAELRDMAAPLPWARVVQAVLAPTAGPATWHRYNLPALNGLARPDHLRADFPRLRLLATEDVQAAAAADWLAQLQLPVPTAEEAANALVVDLPAEAEALVCALGAEGLRPFDTLLMRATGTPAVAETVAHDDDSAAAPPADDLAVVLQAAGFELLPATDAAEDSAAHLIARRRVIIESVSPAECRAAELEAELTATRQALEEEREQHKAARHALEEAQTQAEMLQHQLHVLQSQPVTDQDTVDALKQRLEDAQNRRQDYQAMNQRLMQDLQHQMSRLTDLERQLIQTDAERCELRKQLGMALEIQTAREQSLTELHRVFSFMFESRTAVTALPRVDEVLRKGSNNKPRLRKRSTTSDKEGLI
jgi:hypothetical protein